MSKKKFILLGYFLSLLFIFVGSANAVSNFNVRIDGDEVTLSATHVSSFSYSVKGNAAKTVICKNLSDNASTSTCKISVRNGTYTFYANSLIAADGDLSDSTERTVVTSCSDQATKANKTDSGTVERCVAIDSTGGWGYTTDAPIASCASGYKLDVAVKSNGCSGIRVASGYYRYCKVIFSYSCTKNTSGGNTETPPADDPVPPPGGGGSTVAAATLSSLGVDGYNISPGFSASTKKYTVTVPSDVTAATISAAASGGDFVQNYGPRTVKLNYGKNTFSVKVKNSAGNVNTYSITITRTDNRNTDNTLKMLTVDKGELSPAFSPSTLFYKVYVEKDVTSVGIGAVLNNSASTFAVDYGPRTVTLNDGVTSVVVKVISESGKSKSYSINIVRPTESENACNLTEDKMPLLKEIYLGEEETELDDEEEEEDEDEVIKIPQIENFDSKVLQYTGIEIPYEIEDLIVNAYVLNEGDTVEVTGNDNLEVNVPTNVVIKVTSKACPTTVVEYNLEVTRQPEGETSSNATVKDIDVKGHDIDFEPNVKEYKISVSKKETDLDIDVDTEDPKAKVEIEKPARFGKGAKYVITVTSPDETQTVEYIIRISDVKSGASSILLIILAIIVILVIIYIVLRLMGYRIYFNPAMLGAMFRGNGKDKFDK